MDYSQLYYTLGRTLGYGSLQEFTDAINKGGLQGALQGFKPTQQGYNTAKDLGVEQYDKYSDKRSPAWEWLGGSLTQKFMDAGYPREQAVALAQRSIAQNQEHADYWSDPAHRGEQAGWGNNPNNLADDIFKKTTQAGLDKKWSAGFPQGGASAGAGQQDNISGQLQDFINSMRGPLSPNDPTGRSLTQQGTSASNRMDALRGIHGGASGLNTQMAVGNSLAPYMQHRTDLALQGLGALNSRDLTQMQNSISMLNAQNQAMNFQNQAKQQNYSAQQGQGAGLGGLIGGIAGTGLGALLAPFTGGASLALGGIGAGIGSGIGGMGAGPAPIMGGYQTKPSYGGYTPSGGSSDGNYGGGY